VSGALPWLAWASFGLALLPLLLGLANLALYRRPSAAAPPGAAVSVLIPARNEEAAIEPAVRGALASQDVELEVLVLDDQSTDATRRIVRQLAAQDPRVRLLEAPPLPAGWSGKQHACHLLARHARHDVLLFQDTDVRLSPGAVGRIAGRLLSGEAALVSGFPRQETGSLGERLLVPMMLFLLIGYLPFIGMRLTRWPAFGAACGQLVAVRRDAYVRAGGHAAIRASLHDGLKLPRAFRQAGFRTDLFDATELAACRMYRGWRESWCGFAKNATEGMATPLALPVWTALLFGGHILPWLLAPVALATGNVDVLVLVLAAAVAGLLFRLVLAARLRQPLSTVPLHPVAIAMTLAIQWSALAASWRGRSTEWRGRAYPKKKARQLRNPVASLTGRRSWWGTLESNQAWVAPAELQSAAAPCSTSPEHRGPERRGPERSGP
jgi:Glycosyl transferase family 2